MATLVLEEPAASPRAFRPWVVDEMFYWHGAPMWLTMLGRPVFPLFLFMSAEAFHYTRDRKKYQRRLLAGTWVMAVITTVLQRVFPMNDVILINIAFSTFFVAALWMDAYDNFRNRKYARAIVLAILLFIRSPGNIQWMMAFAAVPMPYTDVPCTGSGAFSYFQRNRKYLNQRNFSYNKYTRNKRE